MIIINGQQYSEEDFAKLQDEIINKRIQEFQELLKQYNCGYSIIVDDGHDFIKLCGLDRNEITLNICRNCASYNNHNYHIIEEEKEKE